MRAVRAFWWLAVLVVIAELAGAALIGAVTGARGHPVLLAALFLALAGAAWSVGARLMDIVTIESLDD